MENTITEQPKTKKKGKGLKVLAIVVASIVLLVLILMSVTLIGDNNTTNMAKSFASAKFDGQIVPVKDADGDWTFTTDREFKIMQLTDVHIGGGFISLAKDRQALTTVATMIQAEKPDLIIVTGDIAFPVPYVAGTFNNLLSTQIFINLMEQLQIYWTVTLGNHDSESYSYFNREQIGQAYSDASYDGTNSNHCLFMMGSKDADGVGNQTIKVKKGNGVVTQVLSLFDSHAYTDGDVLGINWKYDNFHENQLTWYQNKINTVTESNKTIEPTCGIVKSLAFFHIPFHAYRDAWKEYYLNNKADTVNVKRVYGEMGEKGGINASGQETYAVFCGVGETDKTFDAFVNSKSLQGAFCGHDHLNNQALLYKGIQLTYSYSIDCLAYASINQ
ncbi:MAG: metallophosphoesterase, partial [Clostridia bacterium]